MAKQNPDAQTEDPRASEEKEPSGGGAKQMLMTALVLLGLIGGSAGAAVLAAMFVVKAQPVAAVPAESEPEPAADETEKEYELTFEEDLLVNVRDTQQRRYLSARPVLVLDNESALKHLQEKKGELRHLLITLLKSKTLKQLDEPQAADATCREIIETVNAKFELKSPVQRAYFTQFVVN